MRLATQHSIDKDSWIQVAHIKDLQPDQPFCVKVNGVSIALAVVGQQLVAFDNRCPHACGALCRGEFEQNKVHCPEHGWRFDMQTGKTLWPSTNLPGLTLYDVTRIGDKILIRIE